MIEVPLVVNPSTFPRDFTGGEPNSGYKPFRRFFLCQWFKVVDKHGLAEMSKTTFLFNVSEDISAERITLFAE